MPECPSGLRFFNMCVVVAIIGMCVIANTGIMVYSAVTGIIAWHNDTPVEKSDPGTPLIKDTLNYSTRFDELPQGVRTTFWVVIAILVYITIVELFYQIKEGIDSKKEAIK